MTLVTVTVQVDVSETDPVQARAVAKQRVHGEGVKVLRATIGKPRKRDPKPWQPKAWEPGLIVTIGSDKYQIWSQAAGHRHNAPEVWAVPLVESYAPIFKIEQRGVGLQSYLTATGYTTDLTKVPEPKVALAA
jgi:hypothetical protein